MAFMMAVLLVSCSDEAGIADVDDKGAAVAKTLGVTSGPQAQKLFGRVSVGMGDIRGRDCRGGLGLCSVRKDSGYVFDIGSFQSPFDIGQPTYDVATDEVFTIAAEDNGTINFYFPRTVVNSAGHFVSDFDYFEVKQDVLAAHYQLVAGRYSKNTEGDYIVYKVKFTKI